MHPNGNVSLLNEVDILYSKTLKKDSVVSDSFANFLPALLQNPSLDYS